MKQAPRDKSFMSWLAIGAFVLFPPLLLADVVFSQEKTEPAFPGALQPRETVVDPRDKGKEPPKAPHMTCGKCPEGYVKTAVAAPESGSGPGASFNATADLCKGTLQSEDATLIECKPIGYQDQMAVCGTCPEGYREVGRTFLPALCGTEDNGLRTQCQVPNMVGGLPDPTQGGRRCPPDCVGNLPTPGQGTLPPPPKLPGIEIRTERQEEAP